MSWSNKYLGLKRSVKMNRTLDCWGLAWLIYKNELGINLNLYEGIAFNETDKIYSEIEAQKQSETWIKCEKPRDYDIVVLSKKKGANHIGVYVEGGYILHTAHKLPTQSMKVNDAKLAGWNTIDYYRYNG